MAQTEALGGSGLDADENGFVIIQAGERQDRQDTGQVGFVIEQPTQRDERSTRQRAQESASVGVDQPLPRQRKCSVCGELGHTARTCPNVGAQDRVTRAPRASGASLSPAIPVFVGTINLLVTSAFGDNCGISDKETQFMIPSMQRMAERLPRGAADAAGKWIDPVVIVSCFIIWGARIRQIKAFEAEIKYRPDPTEAARANGYVGSTYAVTNEQQNVPQGGTNGIDYHPTTDVIPDAQTQSEPTSNGVPQSIREAFDDRI